jgi:glycosyltransferase involved in cell wall biosynthesis
MEVLALIPYMHGYTPGQRSSIELWEKILKPAGINLHFEAFETPRLREVRPKKGHYIPKTVEMARGVIDRLKLLKSLDQYDAVFVYREAALIGPAFLEKTIAKRGKPIVYMLDDPLYVPYVSSSSGYLSYLKFFGKVADICRVSKVIIANSTHHKEYAEQYNKNVYLVPSIVDTAQYYPSDEPKGNGKICVGWSGSYTTIGNLSVVADALRILSDRVDHKVHLIGSTEVNLQGVDYTAQNWRAETEVADLQKIDIGIVPLVETEWTKRKFNMKVAQFMALGIPPVCTPLGDNPFIIKEGVNGFLASSTSEWVDHIQTLIEDHELRQRMSRNAIETARKHYSVEGNAETIIRAFQSAVEN